MIWNENRPDNTTQQSLKLRHKTSFKYLFSKMSLRRLMTRFRTLYCLGDLLEISILLELQIQIWNSIWFRICSYTRGINNCLNSIYTYEIRRKIHRWKISRPYIDNLILYRYFNFRKTGLLCRASPWLNWSQCYYIVASAFSSPLCAETRGTREIDELRYWYFAAIR